MESSLNRIAAALERLATAQEYAHGLRPGPRSVVAATNMDGYYVGPRIRQEVHGGCDNPGCSFCNPDL